MSCLWHWDLSQFHCSHLSVYHFPLQEKVFFHSLIYAKHYISSMNDRSEKATREAGEMVRWWLQCSEATKYRPSLIFAKRWYIDLARAKSEASVSILMIQQLVFTKSVNSNFHAFWLVPVTWNIKMAPTFKTFSEKENLRDKRSSRTNKYHESDDL